jgi:hypothetical protein
MHGRHLLPSRVSFNFYERLRAIYIPAVTTVHHFEKEPGKISTFPGIRKDSGRRLAASNEQDGFGKKNEKQ